MGSKGLTQEQLDKLRECKTPEDILALAQAEGYELTDEELQQVTGGGDGYCVGGSIWGGMARSIPTGAHIAGSSTTTWIPKTP